MKWTLVVAAAVFAVGGLRASGPTPSLSPITVDYPADGSLFPPDIIPPTFQWRDADSTATIWRIEVSFADRASPIQLWSQGEKLQLGELDTTLVGYVPPTLTPEQEAGHTWKPDPKIWANIKKHSVRAPAAVTITGFRSQNATDPVSSGQVVVHTSKDPVGAPIFFRDVPLLPPPPDHGVDCVREK